MQVDENNNIWLLEPQARVETMDVRSWTIPFGETVPFPFAVVDFETYYSQKYSLTKFSPWEFVQSPAFNPYLAAIMLVKPGHAQISVGPSSKLPWIMIDRYRWLSHNAAFDELVFRKSLQRKFILTNARPLAWDCTLDMLAYLQCRKGLEAACLDLLGVKLDKSTIDRMKGSADQVTENELVQYVYHDVFWPAVLWCQFSGEWPEKERRLSRQTRHIGWSGVYVEAEQLRNDITTLEHALTKISAQIPWQGGSRAIASLDELRKQCLREGIPSPGSLDLDNEVTADWDKRFGKTRPWLHLIKRYTQIRQSITFFEQLLLRRRSNGTVPFSLRYCKAPHTHRWQSGEGLRMQNLNSHECEGIAIRHRLRPHPGEVFIIADCTQIEPRVLNWLAGNKKFLEACASGMSPYEVHARQMGYNKPEPLKKAEPLLYDLYKAQTLALGYQAGPPKFIVMAREYCQLFLHEFEWSAMVKIHGKAIWFSQHEITKARAGHGDPTLTRAIGNGEVALFPPAQQVVKEFRSKSKEIRNYWYQCEDEMRRDAGNHHTVRLPCGTIRYFDVADTPSGLRAWIVYKSTNPDDHRYFYGGKLAENRTQFVSRCVLGEILLRLEDLPVGHLNWHVHDETITRVPEQHAEEMLAWIKEQHRRPIPWAPDLPLGVEVRITDKYEK